MILFYDLKILFIFSFFLLLTACDQQPTEQTKRISVEQQGIEAANKTYFHPAFDFPQGLDWLNVSRPLTLNDLKGRVVVLDFWTYGCINCLHANAILKKIKHQYGDQLLIISIHTPKFENEKNIQTLRKNIRRFEMQHPVVNDTEYLLAKKYHVNAWPSFVVLNKKTEIMGKTVGENGLRLVKKAIKKVLETTVEVISMPKIPLLLETDKAANQLLFAPSKIDINSQYVAISDSLHHRIIITNHQGKIQSIYGGKKSGFKDGKINKVRFNLPQGVILTKTGVYVADSGNHRIRFIDFKTQITTTIAGGGKDLSLLYPFDPAIQATKTALSSPWDLTINHQHLFIAMAGTHQIWQYHINHQTIKILAGDGKEGITDGHFETATFSQPQGLIIQKNKLYVADAESSAIRVLDLNEKKVKTLNGTGLFDFGDQNGDFKTAKLQHPNGLGWLTEDKILISDSYNHKIKRLDLEQQTIQTFIKNGLNEPSDIKRYQDFILIVDSNHDRIMHYDLNTTKIKSWVIYP